MRKVEIKLSSYAGQVGFFHGIFQCGNLENGCDPVAVVELPDGSICEFATSYIKFLSQPAESESADGQALRTTTPAQNVEADTSGVA